MSIRMECDLPYAGESFPFGDLAAFVQQAQTAGADPDTPVVAVTAPQDDAIVVALQVELEGFSLTDRPSDVRLDRGDVAETLAVFEAIEENEGDARMQLAAIRELRQRLTKLAIG
ncbi:MAG: hypothetical protein ABS81_06330 [Pseudonocardia sp. SCN 72-86]|nr:MAG: hypothetical protein ABS81_06330 [Pseudonocardia sp. SCN 72-86]